MLREGGREAERSPPPHPPSHTHTHPNALHLFITSPFLLVSRFSHFYIHTYSIYSYTVICLQTSPLTPLKPLDTHTFTHSSYTHFIQFSHLSPNRPTHSRSFPVLSLVFKFFSLHYIFIFCWIVTHVLHLQRLRVRRRDRGEFK